MICAGAYTANQATVVAVRMAVLANMGASLLVPLNGVRLLGYRALAADGSDMVSMRKST